MQAARKTWLADLGVLLPFTPLFLPWISSWPGFFNSVLHWAACLFVELPWLGGWKEEEPHRHKLWKPHGPLKSCKANRSSLTWVSPNEAWHPTGSRFQAQAPLSHLEAESHWISVGHEQCLILREEVTRHKRCQQVWQLPALSVRSENRTKRLLGVDRACCWWKWTHRPKKLKTYNEFQLSGALLPSI